jgi:hypothetical protein
VCDLAECSNASSWRHAFGSPARCSPATSLWIEELCWLNDERGCCILIAVGWPVGAGGEGARADQSATAQQLELRALECDSMRLLLRTSLPVGGELWGCACARGAGAVSHIVLGCERESDDEATICVVTVLRGASAGHPKLQLQGVHTFTLQGAMGAGGPPYRGLSAAHLAHGANADAGVLRDGDLVNYGIAANRRPTLELLLLSSVGELFVLRIALATSSTTTRPAVHVPAESVHRLTLRLSSRARRAWHLPGEVWVLSEKEGTSYARWSTEPPPVCGGNRGHANGAGTAAAVGAAGLPSSDSELSWVEPSPHTVLCELSILPPQRDVSPLVVLPGPHALVGIGPMDSKVQANGGPPLAAHPVLHCRLQWLLESGRPEAARHLLRQPSCFRRMHCLERLLHNATVHENRRAQSTASSPPRNGLGRQSLLEAVAALLSAVGAAERSRVVAGCAHKTEPSHWADLFRVCGRPDDLLYASLASGDARGAILLLLPVLTECGVAPCRVALRKTQAAAAASGDTRVLKAIGRFEQRLVAGGLSE